MAETAATRAPRRKTADSSAVRGEMISTAGLWASDWRLLQYNPSTLLSRRGIDIFEQMLLDDQILSAISFKREAVMSTGWQIQSPESKPPNWAPTEFVRRRLAAVEDSVEHAMRGMLSCLVYGYSITEKVLEVVADGEDAGMIGVRALKPKAPHYLRFELDQFANIAQIVNDHNGDRIEPGKCIIWSHGDNTFGNPYGKSELEACYRAFVLSNNSYKWLGQYLERLGIPPWVALYNPAAMSDEQQIRDLKSLLKNIQSATSAAIPRPSKDDFDIWTPTHSGNVQAVFIPALEHLKKDIARALLMPGHMGITPDSASGSFARARVALDMFLLSLTAIQARMRHIIQTQLINPLVALNFSTGGVYPQFSFLPLGEDDQQAICTTWAALVDRDIVSVDDDDEQHIRGLLKFPRRDADDEDEKKDATQKTRLPLRYLDSLRRVVTKNEVRSALNMPPLPEDGDELLEETPDPEMAQPGAFGGGDGAGDGEGGGGGGSGGGGSSGGGDSEKDSIEESIKRKTEPKEAPDPGASLRAFVPPIVPFEAPKPTIVEDDFIVTEEPAPPAPGAPGLSPAERRCDFAAIVGRLNGLEDKATLDLALALRKSLYAQIDGWLKRPPTMTRVMKIQASMPLQARTIMLRSLKGALSGGRQECKAEADRGPQKFAGELPTYDPEAALAYLESKADFLVTGLSTKVTEVIRNELLFGLRNGAPFTETRNRLLDLLAPWVGAADVDLAALKPDRLLTTVRTNVTDAYNQGRVIEARRLGRVGIVKGMQHSSVLDKVTTDICRHLQGKVYRIDDPLLDTFTPPLHFRCRSVLLPVTLDIEISDDPAQEYHWISPEERATAERLIPGEFGGSFTATKKNAPRK